ncbi:hypothetical protein ACFTAO_35350 [Paenibacillus rhizoplanae]
MLDTVITSLERLNNDQLSVGIISHVPELRARLPRKLIVVPAEQGGGGSTILLEKNVKDGVGCDNNHRYTSNPLL